MALTRRQLMGGTAGAAAALLASSSLTELLAPGVAEEFTGYGPLVSDPAGVLDLPAGFQYRVIARSGEVMSDG